MKNVVTFITIVLMVVSAVTLNAQKVIKIEVEMTGKTYYRVDPPYLMCSEDGKHGFGIITSFDSNIKVIDFILSCEWNGLSCVEGGVLIIKFKDESKINLKNWNDFNCAGTMYTKISESDWEKLSTIPIVKVYCENGRNNSSYTYEIPINDQNYFIKVGESLKNGNFEVVKK